MRIFGSVQLTASKLSLRTRLGQSSRLSLVSEPHILDAHHSTAMRLQRLSNKCSLMATSSACKLYALACCRRLSSHPYPTICLPRAPHLGAHCYRHLSTTSVRYSISPSSSSSIMTRTGCTSANTRINRPHNTTQRVRTYSQTQSRRSSMYRTSVHGSTTTLHLSWLFRTNVPPRRGHSLPSGVQKRSIFGMGEIIGVLANVSLTLWDETRGC